jgi:hypothetical protein
MAPALNARLSFCTELVVRFRSTRTPVLANPHVPRAQASPLP